MGHVVRVKLEPQEAPGFGGGDPGQIEHPEHFLRPLYPPALRLPGPVAQVGNGLGAGQGVFTAPQGFVRLLACRDVPEEPDPPQVTPLLVAQPLGIPLHDPSVPEPEFLRAAVFIRMPVKIFSRSINSSGSSSRLLANSTARRLSPDSTISPEIPKSRPGACSRKEFPFPDPQP